MSTNNPDEKVTTTKVGTAKVKWQSMPYEEHRTKYKHTFEWEVVNKRPFSVSVNICMGPQEHKRDKADNGERIVKKGVHDALKQCPGYQFTLRPRGKEDSRIKFSSFNADCMVNSDHIASLIQAGHIILKRKKGKDYILVTLQDLATNFVKEKK